MGNRVSPPNRVMPPIEPTWQFYKIADGPLDIVGKKIEIFVEGIDTPIIGSKWKSHYPESGEGHILEAYKEDVGGAKILVLNEATYSRPVDTNGTYPLSGIFVSGNVRSIYIAGSEVVHKIDNKYIDLDVIPSVIFDVHDEYHPYSSYGYNEYVVTENPTKLNMRLSNGYVIDGIESERISYDGSDAGEPGYVAYDYEEEDWFVYPGSEEGKVILLLKVYAIKEQDDDSNLCCVTAFITIQTGGVD